MNDFLVVTVLKSGGHYRTDYIEHLQVELKKHTPRAQLVCLSDVNVPCPRIRLVEGWPSWWSKIELFRPGLFHIPVLFMDLDTHIARDIAPLMTHAHNFTALRDLMHPARGMASGLMAFSGDKSNIYEAFKKNPDRFMGECQNSEYWGDQGFIKQHVTPEYWQDLYPGAVQSAKLHLRNENERIVCYHGKPRPRDVGWDIHRVNKKRGNYA